MKTNTMEHVFHDLDIWANTVNDETPLDMKVLTDFKDGVIRALFDQDRETLNAIKEDVSLIASRIQPLLKQIPLSSRQALEIVSLLTVARGFLSTMEQEDPLSAARFINHGSKILDIVLNASPDDLNLSYIRENWPDYNSPPSSSTISRALCALEETGFIRREGATQGRKFKVLPKAQRWKAMKTPRLTEKEDKSSPVGSENKYSVRTYDPKLIDASLFINQVREARIAS